MLFERIFLYLFKVDYFSDFRCTDTSLVPSMALENSWAVKTRHSVWWGKKKVFFFWAEFTSVYVEPLSALEVLYGMFHKSNILVKEDLIWHCFSSLLQNRDVPPWVGATAHRSVKWMFIKPAFSGTCGEGFFFFFFCSYLFFWNWLDQIDLTLHVICRFLGILKFCIHPRVDFWLRHPGSQCSCWWSASVIRRSREVLPEGNLQVSLFLFSVHR